MRSKLIFVSILLVWGLLFLEFVNLSLLLFPPIYNGMNYETVVKLLGDDSVDVGSGFLIEQWKDWKGEITVHFYKTANVWKVDDVTTSPSMIFIFVYLIYTILFTIITVFVIKVILKKHNSFQRK